MRTKFECNSPGGGHDVLQVPGQTGKLEIVGMSYSDLGTTQEGGGLGIGIKHIIQTGMLGAKQKMGIQMVKLALHSGDTPEELTYISHLQKMPSRKSTLRLNEDINLSPPDRQKPPGGSHSGIPPSQQSWDHTNNVSHINRRDEHSHWGASFAKDYPELAEGEDQGTIKRLS